MTQPPWSYSSLTAFETCPRRYYLLRVAKAVTEKESDAIRWGNLVHKALELRVKDGTELPKTMVAYEPMVQKILAKPVDKVLTEQQLAITDDFKPTGWWSKDAWCRGVIDLGLANKSTVILLDWKTGNVKPDSDQLKLFAALYMAHSPEIDTAKTGFVWLKDRKLTTEKFKRDDLPTIWQLFTPRVRRLEKAFETDHWPAKPSGLCRAWCPVGRHNCEYCGSR